MFRKNIRLKSYNYKSDGYYFITICTARFKPYLVGESKKIAEKVLLSLSENIKGVNIDFYIFMPTHLHFIVVLENSNLTVGEIIRRFKAYVTKETKIKPFWEWNYYEHVIRNEDALFKIREYIKYNAEKHSIDLSEIDK
jgi:REP element-mobilizing transposase RayT